jgi:hypothetical protein
MVKVINSHVAFDGSRSEIEDFASLFHQDFSLMEKDPNEYAKEIFSVLSKKQKSSLRESFIKLLKENSGKKQKGLINSWRRLGAVWWDNKIDLRATMQNWINYLES